MLKKRSIFISKQVYSYSIVFAMMVLIFFIAFYNYIIITSEKISTLGHQELADKTIKQVEYYLNDMDNVAYQVMTNSQLLGVFNKLQQDKMSGNYFDTDLLLDIDMRSILTTINGPHKLMWRLSVYNQYDDYISAGAITERKSIERFLREETIVEQMEILKNALDKNMIIPPEPDRWADNYSSKYVTIRRPLMNIYSQEVYGIVEIQQDIKTLIKNIEFDVMASIDITITDDKGRLIFDLSKNPLAARSANRVSKTSERYGWTVTLSQSKSAMLAPYKLLITTVLIGSIVIILLMIMAIVIIANRLSKPIILLKNTVSQLNIQNISENYQSDHTIDEVRELNLAFSAMLNRLSESVALEKKAWLLALQAQMNPHFLYNSLAIISAAAVEEDNHNIVMMCHELSNMLRYIASYKEMTVTLGDEVQHVKSYLELMKWRYEEYFSYEIDIEEGMLSMPVPKLILQPLAENCFTHAFAEVDPPYFIKIAGRLEEDRWLIEVYDNGSGLKDEEKQQIIDKIEDYWNGGQDKYSKMKIGGLGLVNTLIRMKLNMNKTISYKFEDNLPKGLKITIWGDAV